MTDAGMTDAQIQLLGNILSVPATVGHERPLFGHLHDLLDGPDRVATQYQGLLAVRCGSGKGPVFAAHIDRHGLVCNAPGEYEYAAHALRYRDSNPASARAESPELLERICERFLDQHVRAYNPWDGAQIAEGRITGSRLSQRLNTLVFTIDADAEIPVGAPLAYDTPMALEADTVAGQIDNALCVAMLADLCLQGFDGIALFSAEEEAGRSWRYLMDWMLREERAGREHGPLYVIDTSPFADRETQAEQQIVLRQQDEHARFDPMLTNHVMAVCDELALSHRFKDSFIQGLNEQAREKGESEKRLGATELGRLIVASDGAMTGTTLQIATTGYHTAWETALIEHIHPLNKLMRALCERPVPMG
ncbi:MAG: peptidase M42 [Alphaproteobacteria bacterium]